MNGLEHGLDIYVFTGTGNTLTAAKMCQTALEDHGVEVQLLSLKDLRHIPPTGDRAIGFAIPVAAQGTYPFIWKLVESLPEGKGTPVVFMDTMAYFSGGVVGPIGKILRRKGYRLLGAQEVIAQNNFLQKRIDPERVERVNQKMKEKIDLFSDQLVSGKAKWRRVPLLSDIMAAFSKNPKLWALAENMPGVDLDRDKCVGCGLCVKACPVTNFELTDGKAHMLNKCEKCQKCRAVCPAQALTTTLKNGEKAAVHRAATVDELVRF